MINFCERPSFYVHEAAELCAQIQPNPPNIEHAYGKLDPQYRIDPLVGGTRRVTPATGRPQIPSPEYFRI